VTTPTVSIIIPVHNAERWIRETVISAQQKCPEPVEILAIDDGSTDGSADLLRQEFPDVRVVSTANRGVSHARNLGISLSSGRFLVFLDADDALALGKLDRQLELMRDTGADVVYGNWQRLRPGPGGAFRVAEKVERKMERDPEIELFTTFWCPPGAYLFRRSIVEKVGGFSPRLPVIQDARFALDCALRNAHFVHDAEIACLYRTHRGNSISTRDPSAFVRDCLTNALEVAQWWENNGGLTSRRREALLGVFDYIARTACGTDLECFATACRQFDEVRGDHPVPGRLATRLLASLVGYTRTRRLAWRLRNWNRRSRRRRIEADAGRRA
jgi:glycosyltransferase involved in cell wall biosynthesis